MRLNILRSDWHHRFALLVAVLPLIAMPAACEEPSDPDCSRSQPDREDAALVLLASHRSNAFVTVIDTLLDDPKLVLDSPDLELDSSGRVVVVGSRRQGSSGLQWEGCDRFSAAAAASRGRPRRRPSARPSAHR